MARGLALSGSGADGRHRDDGHIGVEHGAVRAKQAKVGAAGHGERSPVHHVLVGDVAVRKDDLVDPLTTDEIGKLLFGDDGNAVGIPGLRLEAAGYTRPSISGICVAVKATTGSWDFLDNRR